MGALASVIVILAETLSVNYVLVNVRSLNSVDNTFELSKVRVKPIEWLITMGIWGKTGSLNSNPITTVSVSRTFMIGYYFSVYFYSNRLN